MNQVWKIMRWEFINRVKTKLFLITTFALPFFMGAVMYLPTLLMDLEPEDESTIGLVYENEIKPKHLEILGKRPLPEMLDNSKLVDNLKQVESPSLGKFYEEKKMDETMKKEKYPNKT